MNERTSTEIARLIEQAENARDRAMLLVLFRMQQGIDANTDAATEAAKVLKDHAEKLDAHEALFDKGRGGWKVLGVLGVLAYGAMGWVLLDYVQEQRLMKEQIVELRVRIATPTPAP